MPRKIVSGGQTGADRAAFDAALACGVEIGGWVPRGRLAEDGRVPERYAGLREAESADPSLRTALNVRDSDATLVVSLGPLTGGSLLTRREALRLGRPLLHVDLDRLAPTEAVDQVVAWLRAVNPTVLNVAGPRASEAPEIGRHVTMLLESVLRVC